MAQFISRTTSPSTTDKNWIKTTAGGYNYCILIKNGSCLPNCVGYAWGRWRELLGKYHNLSRGNAENWYGNKGDGYKRGKTPKLGAVICWAKGKAGNANDGAGHVAIVEKINSDGSILTSNSGYGSKRFWTQTIKKGYAMSGYTLQGFIYLPIEFINESAKPASKPTINTYKVVKGDTLIGIGSKTGVKWQDIANINGIKSPYTIYPNQLLKLSSDGSKSVETTSYYPKYTGKSNSLVDALKSLKIDSSFGNRKKIALKNNIVKLSTLYLGTTSQNTKMLELLKAGKLKK
jgi:surface antigen